MGHYHCEVEREKRGMVCETREENNALVREQERERAKKA